MLQLVIDKKNEQALYLQIAVALKTQIETGELPPASKLPSSRRLAKQLGVNRITIVNAYAELAAEGLVTSHVGQGTFVADITSVNEQIHPAPLWQSALKNLSEQTLSANQPLSNQMVREMMRLARQPGLISFASGTTADEFLPVIPFRQAINEVLRQNGVAALQYEEAVGYYPFRQTIAHYLNNHNLMITADNVLVTDGCQQALDLVLRVFGREGDTVLVENPAYLGLLDVIKSHRLVAIGAPTDEQGLQVDKLEPFILRHQPQLIYVAPNFQNPTGAIMPLNRRKKLLQLAHKYNLPILEDNIHQELYYHKPPPPTLASLDQGSASLVFHVSSYSKILMPGIRLGYLITPPAFQKQVLTVKQAVDISSSALSQRALNYYLSAGYLKDHLLKIREAYKIRRDTMLNAVAHHFPKTASWQKPDGGLYLWITLDPEGPTATQLYLKAMNYGVTFAIGSLFFSYQPSAYAMRLNFVYHSPTEIEEGIRRLGKAWRELLQTGTQQIRTPHHPALPIL